MCKKNLSLIIKISLFLILFYLINPIYVTLLEYILFKLGFSLLISGLIVEIFTFDDNVSNLLQVGIGYLLIILWAVSRFMITYSVLYLILVLILVLLVVVSVRKEQL